MSLPRISIITPSFNQAQFIEETLKSVLNQNYPDLEHIVIDGGSTDGSAEIIRRYESELSYWVSEKDRGQVHAINKGLERATGDIVAYLNSDDLYLPGALHAVASYFSRNTECEWLCGDTVLFGEGHETEFVSAVVPKSAAHCLSWAYRSPQPGMFWSRPLIQKFGFDERWSYCFDHECYVRLLLAGHKCASLGIPVAGYRLHSASKTVAESSKMDQEFDVIAEQYEPLLQSAGRRWSRSTRFLRKSFKASEAGDNRQGRSWLLKALAADPSSLVGRPFWGCLRRAARAQNASD